MTLASPNYPKWYNADGVGCEWLISAPEGFIIALEFNHFNVSNLLLDFIKKFALAPIGGKNNQCHLMGDSRGFKRSFFRGTQLMY